MRLTPIQMKVIRDTARRCFGAGIEVWLFGSRVGNTRRGGDIDLFIETDVPSLDDAWAAQRKFLARLYIELGEQKIDVVVNGAALPDSFRSTPSPGSRVCICESRRQRAAPRGPARPRRETWRSA